MSPAPEPASVALRRLHEEATPGPWTADTEQPLDCVVWGPGKRPDRDHFIANIGAAFVPVVGDEAKEDAATQLVFDVERADTVLIATLRNALPALADLVAAVESELGLGPALPGKPLSDALAALRERLEAKP